MKKSSLICNFLYIIFRQQRCNWKETHGNEVYLFLLNPDRHNWKINLLRLYRYHLPPWCLNAHFGFPFFLTTRSCKCPAFLWKCSWYNSWKLMFSINSYLDKSINVDIDTVQYSLHLFGSIWISEGFQVLHMIVLKSFYYTKLFIDWWSVEII